jgi:pimeloyl-ACP methyl ester carboxylesterase
MRIPAAQTHAQSEIASHRQKGHSNETDPSPLPSAGRIPPRRGPRGRWADFLDTISGPIILVGHSLGGAVITNAATGDTQGKALVYVDVFAPAQGQTIGQLVTADPGSCVLSAVNVIAPPYLGAPAGAVDVHIKQSVFPLLHGQRPSGGRGTRAGSHPAAADTLAPGHRQPASARAVSVLPGRTHGVARNGDRIVGMPGVDENLRRPDPGLP